jgi:hypothetical protein
MVADGKLARTLVVRTPELVSVNKEQQSCDLRFDVLYPGLSALPLDSPAAPR